MKRLLPLLWGLSISAGALWIRVQRPQDGSPLLTLMEGVDPELRVTVALRFPEGRGRRRYAAQLCDELGMDRRHARRVVELEPWTYTAVLAALVRIRDDHGSPERG